MNMKPARERRAAPLRAQAGFSLIEILIALLITVLLIFARRRKFRAYGLFLLIPAALVWSASCLLGAFSLMVSVHPGWFG